MTIQTTTYPQKYNYLADLAQSYAQAGKSSQAARFYRMAGDKAAAEYANDDALAFYEQALTLTADANPHERFRILLAREQLHGLIGQVEAQRQELKSLEALANYLNSDGMRGEVAIRQANYQASQGYYGSALTLTQLAARLAHHISATQIEADAYLTMGNILTRQGNYEAAASRFREALTLANQAQARLLQADIYRGMGVLANERRQFAEAAQYYEQALSRYEEQGNKLGRTHVLNNLGHIEQLQGRLTKALTYWEEAQTLFHGLGDREGQVRVLVNLSTIYMDTGQYAQAQQHNEEALQICRDIKLLIGQCFALLNLGLTAHYQNQDKQAVAHLQEALQLAEMMESKQLEASALGMLGHAFTALGNIAEADRVYWEALTLWDEFGLTNWMAETRAGLARAQLSQQKINTALTLVDEILVAIAADPELNGVEGPIRIYLTCYQVLQATGDQRAADVLEQGYQQLQQLLSNVVDETLRESMQQNIVAHKIFLDLYEATIN